MSTWTHNQPVSSHQTYAPDMSDYEERLYAFRDDVIAELEAFAELYSEEANDYETYMLDAANSVISTWRTKDIDEIAELPGYQSAESVAADAIQDIFKEYLTYYAEPRADVICVRPLTPYCV